MSTCRFCQPENLIVIKENKLALAFYDGRPINSGHCLVIPKRHVETYFEATAEEHAAITELIKELRLFLDEHYKPGGYNIGTNIGPAAGQTVFHFHIHIIPRYKGDTADPRGGVRKVIANRSAPDELKSKALH